MATYDNDLRLKEIATGDESGTWGTSTNTNLELIAEAFSYGTQASFSSDADATTTIADAATDPVRSLYLKVTSSATLTATRTLTIAPNTVSKVWIIENATTGSQSINISQGSGANVTIPNGQVKVVYSDGAGAGAAVVDALTDLELSATLKVGTNLTVGGTYTGGGLMTTGGNIVIPNAGNIGSASDTDAMAIASSGVVTFSQIPLFSLGLGATSFNDNNITNVGDIALDSISSDAGTTVTVTLGTDAGDDFLVGNNNAFTVTGDNDRVGIGTADPSVALDVGSETDAILIAKGTTAQRPTGAAGQFRYNTTLEKFEGYTTEWGEIGGGTSTNTFTTDILAGDGSTTAFTISQAVDENNLVVFIDGVFQAQDAYSVSGTTLTMSAAPANGAVLTVYSVKGAVAGSNFGIATMTGDNSDTTLTLPFNPVNENNVQVYIDGVYQNKDTFSVSGTTLTFSTAPPTGTAVEAMIVSQTSVNTATILKDADEDTKVEVEQSTDEDKIRFTTGGTERAIMDSSGTLLQGANDGSVTPLTVKNTSTNAASEARIEFNQGGTTHGYITSSYNSNSPYMVFSVGSGSAEKARITSGGTLAVGASANAQGLLTLSDGGAEQMEFFAGNASNLNTTQHYNRSGANYVDNRIIANTHQFYSGAVQAVRINGSYNMGIGSDGDSTHRLRLTSGTGGARCLNMSVGNSGLCASTNNASGTANYDAFAFTTAGGNTQVGGIVVGGSSTAYNTTSDYRLKENVDYTWDATTRLKQLRPARFNWISDSTNTLVDGFLAHEVEDVVPEAITGTKDATETLTNVVRSAGGLVLAEGVTEDEWTAGKADGSLWTEDDVLPEGVSVGDVKNKATYPSDSTWDASLTKDVYQNIDQAKLVPLLVKTIQELEARITTLENA
jgi:hypothetical protein